MLDSASLQRVISMSIAAFGAIVSSTFPLSIIFAQQDIAAAFYVSSQDVGWVVTLYNVGQILGLPLAFFLTSVFGRRRAMLISGVGYILSSFLIVLIKNFEVVLFLRILHGLFAGMMPILMFIILFSTHQPGLIRTRGLTYFAVSTAIGIGISAWFGSIFLYSENWRMLFIVPALGICLYVFLANFLFREDPIKFEMIKVFDWVGYVLISIALCSIVVFLSEGERHFWFEAWWITGYLVTGVIFLIMTIYHFLNYDKALFKLTLFYKPFSYALVFQIIFRFGSLFVIWIIPQFLIQLSGFRIEQIAEVLWPFSVGTFIGIMSAYYLSAKVDQRFVMSIALGILSLSALYCSFSTSMWSIQNFLLPIFVAGIGQGLFSLSTLHLVLYDIIPVEGPTCGIGFNYARVLGLVGGIGVLGHFINEREKLHSAMIGEEVHLQSEATLSFISQIQVALSDTFSDVSALNLASYSQLNHHVRAQAMALSYNDAFLLIFIVLFVAAACVWVFPHSKAIH